MVQLLVMVSAFGDDDDFQEIKNMILVYYFLVMWSVDITVKWQVWISRVKVLQEMIGVKQGNAETCQLLQGIAGARRKDVNI